MLFDALWKDFLDETVPLLARVEKELLALETMLSTGAHSAESQTSLRKILGDLHTIKGNSGMMGLQDFSMQVHQLEDLAHGLETDVQPMVVGMLLSEIDSLRVMLQRESLSKTEIPAVSAAPSQSQIKAISTETPTLETSIRVDFQKLDLLLETVGDLVIQQNMLREQAARLRIQPDDEQFAALEESMEQLQKRITRLQTSIMSTRLLPVATLFQRFSRTIRDQAQKEGKQAKLTLRGAEVELDKAILDVLSEPLVHLVRNALGHGIEKPETRNTRGKAAEGTIVLEAKLRSGMAQIAVHDDGNGIDLAKIKKRAAEIGFSPERMSDFELQQMIFHEGFSTASAVSSLSGRGVGLDVVKRSIEDFGGKLQVASTLGKGTSFILQVPLSLSMFRALLVGVGSERYAIPFVFIVETVRMGEHNLQRIGGRRMLRWREQLLSIVNLAQITKTPDTETECVFCVIIRDNLSLKAIAVSAVLGQYEVVSTSLEKIMGKIPGVSGVTLLGDGQVVPILDIQALLHEEAS